MSFKAMTWAASVKTPASTQKLILLLLADRAGDENTCYPSLQRIADDACISRRCVIENIKKLAANGFIMVEKRTIASAEVEGQVYNKSNLYMLNVGNYPLGNSNSKYLVVNIEAGGGEPDALGSERGAPGVVNQMHPNQSLESVIESTSVATASAEGKESCDQSKKPQQESMVAPPSWSKEKSDALDMWLQHKKERKSSYKPTGFKAFLKKHDDWNDGRFIDAVEFSVENNYLGIYEPNSGKQKTPNNGGISDREMRELNEQMGL